ncbi:3541_t:CDS:2 [Dentiscutata erythropus]|uniref:3541_t:CDS:1 n=1 Tax=Dentiscutata erythropus TaxID=1348616 RepID=A0A9N9NNZ2_9GLOM|nr:3541_t:CDS:2 [Dentiscutata erythropus]
MPKTNDILPTSIEDERVNAIQLQQDTLSYEREEANQIIEDLNISYEDSSYATSVANALNEYFYDLEKNIPIEEILNEMDIINLINMEICSKDNELNNPDNSEEEPVLNDADKSLTNWIMFFKQQDSDEFTTEDLHIFKKY